MHFMYGGKEDLELVISAVLHCSSLGAVFSFARWKEEDNIFYQFLRVLNSLFRSLRATSPCWRVARILARSARERRSECQGQVISCLTNPWEVYIPQSFRSVVWVFFEVFLYGGWHFTWQKSGSSSAEKDEKHLSSCRSLSIINI